MMQQQQPVLPPQGGALAQNQMVIAEQPAPSVVSAKDRSCNWTGVKVTGIMQIVCGSLIVILGISSAIVNRFAFTYQQFASPIWCGILFFSLTGILGALAGLKRNRCAVIAYMVMSIFAALASFGFGYGTGVLLAVAAVCKSELDIEGDSGLSSLCFGGGDLLVVYILLIILAVFEFVVSIVGASMTCGIVCCSGPTARHTVYHDQVIISTQPNVYIPGQVAQQQYAYPTQQPGHTPSQGLVEPPPPAYDPITSNMTQPLIK